MIEEQENYYLFSYFVTSKGLMAALIILNNVRGRDKPFVNPGQTTRKLRQQIASIKFVHNELSYKFR